jgi:hypothetical protein
MGIFIADHQVEKERDGDGRDVAKPALYFENVLTASKPTGLKMPAQALLPYTESD